MSTELETAIEADDYDTIREVLDSLGGAFHRLNRHKQSLEKRIDSNRHQIRASLSRIGVSASRNPEETTINPQRFLRRGDAYGHQQAKQAASTARSTETLKRELEQVKDDIEDVCYRIERAVDAHPDMSPEDVVDGRWQDTMEELNTRQRRRR